MTSPVAMFEGRKQGRGAVPLVPVAESIQRLAIGQAEALPLEFVHF